MKTLTQSVATIALLGTLTLGMSMNIDAQLEAISTASETDRVTLVNDLKTELQSMTPEQRQEVIGAVRTELGAKDGTGEGTGTMAQTRTQMKQRAQSVNADGMQQMQGAQQASQKRADAGISMATTAVGSHTTGTLGAGGTASVDATTTTTTTTISGGMFGKR